MRRLPLIVGLVWTCGVGGLYLGAAVTPEGSGLASTPELGALYVVLENMAFAAESGSGGLTCGP